MTRGRVFNLVAARAAVLEHAPMMRGRVFNLVGGARRRAMTRVFTCAAAFAIAAALAVLGRAPPASAAPSRLVTAPAGWAADPEQAAELDRRLAKVAHFDGLTAQTAAEAYVASQPGVALFASRATAELPDPAAAPRAARAALDQLRAITRRSALAGGAASEHAWQERVEPDARAVTATLSWSDPSSHTVATARILVASDGRRIAAVTGECLAGAAADRALAEACIAQLASLDPGIAPGERVALAPAPSRPAEAAPGTRSDPAAPAPPTMSAVPSDPSRPAPQLGDRPRVVLPPMVIPATRPEADRRPIYLGAGLLALAVVFWWNRRRRDRFESEDADRDPGKAPGRAQRQASGERAARRRPRRDADADADAEALRAAALGHDAGAPADELRASGRSDAPAEESPELSSGSGSDRVPRS